MDITPMQSVIAGTPEEVFDLLADAEHETSWNPDVRSIHRVGDGPLGAGARWQGVYRGMGAMDVRLDAYERPRRLVFSTTGPRLDMHFTFSFAPNAAGCEMTVSGSVQPKGMMRLLQPVLPSMMRKTFTQRPAQMELGVRRRRDAERPAG